MKKEGTYRIVGVVTGLMAALDVMYLWTILGQRGLHADATHTNGYVTSTEILLMLLAPLCVVGSIIAISKAKKIDARHKLYLTWYQAIIVSVTILYCIIIALLTR